MTDRPIHIVGGGLAGLVAAITAAEQGAPVILHEGSDHLGGRALSASGRPGVNLGPHVAYTDGALLRWLRRQSIDLPLRRATYVRPRVIDDEGSRLPITEILRLSATVAPRTAPIDLSFADWTVDSFGTDRSELMARIAGLFTFHHDPGALSAQFVWDRWRRALLGIRRARWIGGGWNTVIDALSTRALGLGVDIAFDDRVTSLAQLNGPAVIATPLAAAGRLLDRTLEWPGTRTALVDVLATSRRHWPDVIVDIRSGTSTCSLIERETAFDPDLVGNRGVDLYQAQLGIPPDVNLPDAVARIEGALDLAVDRWREQVRWRDARVVVNSAGAVDPPGASWRDRPGIEQGDDCFLAGDAVAAPGMLSEVSVNSAVQAARLALDGRRRRMFATSWPSVDLTPARRMAILGAALPDSSTRTAQLPAGGRTRTVEPVDETGPGYRIDARRGFALGTAVDSGRLTAFASAPRWLPFRELIAGVSARAALRFHTRPD